MSLVVEDEEEEEVQDEQSQEGESGRETRLRILEVESASQKAGSCGKGEEEDMRQHLYRGRSRVVGLQMRRNRQELYE